MSRSQVSKRGKETEGREGTGRAQAQHLIDLKQVTKIYRSGAVSYPALRGIGLTIDSGEFVAVVGKSGSGKSTLLNMITGIDRPTTGQVWVNGSPLHTFDEDRLAVWRGRSIGVVFQFFQLLPTLTVIENIMLPMDFCNACKARERVPRALQLLEEVDLVDQAYKLPSELSGGQQQRVAMGRALANDPPILVADEPTGNLDTKTADAVFRSFEQMVDDGKTVLMVTHDRDLAQRIPRKVMLADGLIAEERNGGLEKAVRIQDPFRSEGSRQPTALDAEVAYA